MVFILDMTYMPKPIHSIYKQKYFETNVKPEGLGKFCLWKIKFIKRFHIDDLFLVAQGFAFTVEPLSYILLTCHLERNF